MLKIVIPVAPLTKKDSPKMVYNRDDDKMEIYKSKKYKDYCRIAGMYMDPLNIDFPVNVKMTFFLPNRYPSSLLGLQEAVEEVLVDCNMLSTNDSRVLASTDGSRILFDKTFPRTEIEISRIGYTKPRNNKYRNKKNNKTDSQ